MTHRRLFDLQVRHDFFSGGTCPDVSIEPRAWAPTGARALARHRLITRRTTGGIEVLGPVDGEGRPVIDFADDLRLSFDLKVTSERFIHYTDLHDWEGRPFPSYRGTAAEGGPLEPAADPSARPPDVAAALEISGVTATWLAAPPRFTLDLKARRALWVYYLLTARPNGQSPELRDDEPGRGLSFDGVLLSRDDTSTHDDPVGQRLLARHPDRRCFRFASALPLTCRRTPVRGLALYIGTEQLVRELPNPDLRHHATLAVAPGGAAQDSLFCVLEY